MGDGGSTAVEVSVLTGSMDGLALVWTGLGLGGSFLIVSTASSKTLFFIRGLTFSLALFSSIVMRFKPKISHLHFNNHVIHILTKNK